MTAFKQLNDTCQTANSIIDLKPNCYKLLNEIAEDMVKHCPDEFNEEFAKEIISLYQQTLKSMQHIDDVRNALVNTRNQVKADTSGGGLSANESFKRNLAEGEKSAAEIENSPELEQFREKITHLLAGQTENEDDDSQETSITESADGEAGELRITESHLSFKDPISQMEIADPVQNKLCKHNYDRHVILEYIAGNGKGNQKRKCPYAGCSNTTPLTESCLVDNWRLKKKIAASQKKK